MDTHNSGFVDQGEFKVFLLKQMSGEMVKKLREKLDKGENLANEPKVSLNKCELTCLF